MHVQITRAHTHTHTYVYIYNFTVLYFSAVEGHPPQYGGRPPKNVGEVTALLDVDITYILYVLIIVSIIIRIFKWPIIVS